MPSMRLFLDDERFPVQPERWVVVRSVEEAVALLRQTSLSMLEELSLDHDLGTEKTGRDFVLALIAMDLDMRSDRRTVQHCLPKQLKVRYHSQNPSGVITMRSWLSNYCALQEIELIET